MFKKLSKSIGRIAGKVIDPLNLTKGKAGSFGEGLFGGGNMSDILLGKKQGGQSADAIAAEIRAAQSQGIASARQGLTDLNKALETPADQMVRNQFATQQRGMVTGAEDARRKAQELMARRGLQNTSLGFRAERGAVQDLANQTSALNAQLPGAIRQQQMADAQARINAGQGLFGQLGGGAGVQFKPVQSQRSGGLLGIAGAIAPLAGTVAGGMMGGAPGAMVGGQAGNGLSTLFNSRQNPNAQQGMYA